MFQIKLLLKLLHTRGEILLEIFMANQISLALSTILISSRVKHKLEAQKLKILKIVKNVRKKWRIMGLEKISCLQVIPKFSSLFFSTKTMFEQF